MVLVRSFLFFPAVTFVTFLVGVVNRKAENCTAAGPPGEIELAPPLINLPANETSADKDEAASGSTRAGTAPATPPSPASDLDAPWRWTDWDHDLHVTAAVDAQDPRNRGGGRARSGPLTTEELQQEWPAVLESVDCPAAFSACASHAGKFVDQGASCCLETTLNCLGACVEFLCSTDDYEVEEKRAARRARAAGAPRRPQRCLCAECENSWVKVPERISAPPSEEEKNQFMDWLDTHYGGFDIDMAFALYYRAVDWEQGKGEKELTEPERRLARNAFLFKHRMSDLLQREDFKWYYVAGSSLEGEGRGLCIIMR